MPTAFEKVHESRKRCVDMLLEQMQNGHMPSEWGWNRELFMSYNPLSGARYKGGNRFRLALAAWERDEDGLATDNRWMTFKQATDAGYHVKKGAKGVLLEHYTFEKKITNEDGLEEMVELDRPIVSIFYVFNGADIEGLPPIEGLKKEFDDKDTIEIVERMIRSSECPINEISQPDAYYSPMRDMIVVPPRGAFKSEVSFLATVLHEMSHSTGHASRLARDMSGGFGSTNYAKEELRAEFGSMLTQSDLGIDLKGEHLVDHSNYIISWNSILKDDPDELFRAIRDAEKIADRLMANYNRQLEAEKGLSEKDISGGEVIEDVGCSKKMCP